MTGRIWIALALVALAAPATAATLDEVQDCMDGNQPQSTSLQTIVMNAHDRIGSVTQTRARIYWRKFDDGLSKVLVRLSDPPEMRGAAILMLEKKGSRNDMFMYLPELHRVKRVTGHMMSGSMFGTDFSYEEFESLQGLENEDFAKELLSDTSLDGRPVYLMQATAKQGLEEKPNYEKVMTYVDQETCVMLKVEFFERGNRLRKRLLGDAKLITQSAGKNVLQRIEVFDLRDETKTELVVEDIEFGADIKTSMFTTRMLERMGGKTF
jgi:hypothetical protein